MTDPNYRVLAAILRRQLHSFVQLGFERLEPSEVFRQTQATRLICATLEEESGRCLSIPPPSQMLPAMPIFSLSASPLFSIPSPDGVAIRWIWSGGSNSAPRP